MTPRIYNGVADFASHYDHFIIDIWGVLHDGQKAYPGAASALQHLKDAGKQVLLLSNSPNRTSRVVQKVLEPIGIGAHLYDFILTSGEAAHAHMAQHHGGQRVYTFWDDEHPTAIEGLDVTRVFDLAQADFIYGSLMPYDSVADTYAPVLAQALARNLPLVCGNPDRVVGHGDSLHLCVGALAEAYEAMGGPVTWIGKPYLPVYEQARAMLGQPDRAKICAIGDGLITDVGGAVTFGCDVVWNVEGIHWDEIQSAGRIDPARVAAALDGKPHPTGLMHGFRL